MAPNQWHRRWFYSYNSRYKGGKVFEKAINNGEKIPVSSLDNGVYIVSLHQKNSTQTQKLVIRK